MSMKKIPIEDLLCFIEEQRDQENNKFKTIIDYIKNHFFAIKNYEIYTVFNKMIFDNLCFLEHGFIKNGKMPLVEGVLLKRNKNEYGLLFKRALDKSPLPDRIYANFKVWLVKQNSLIVERFEPIKWDEWGLLTSYYDYPDYEPCYNKNLGSRALSFGDVGKDVFLLQKIVQKFEPSLKITGEFDLDTERCLNKIRYSFQLDGSEPRITEDQILIITNLLADDN